MKALITAGGRATRLRPISYTINKHLIPLGNRPMIFNALEKISEAGITEVYINVNPNERELQSVVGDGTRWGIQITYIEQQGGPLGLAHIIKNAQPYLGAEPFIFYLGDNIILGSIREFVAQFAAQQLDCLLALSHVTDPQRFGVPEYDEKGSLVRVVEKPEHPKSDQAVTGIYMYSPRVFEAVAHITPSARGELEISDVHTWLLQHGARVGTREITGWWKDTGKPDDLLQGNALLLAERIRSVQTEGATMHPTVRIIGNVFVGEGTVIGPGVTLYGPLSIGSGCYIERSIIGPDTSIGDHTRIEGTKIDTSIVFDHVHISMPKHITHSIIGSGAHIASAPDGATHGNRMIIGDASSIEL